MIIPKIPVDTTRTIFVRTSTTTTLRPVTTTTTTSTSPTTTTTTTPYLSQIRTFVVMGRSEIFK